ncbi:MAG: hypothetical protein V1881_03745 [Candidatus Micrarchaeota archaeon]
MEETGKRQTLYYLGLNLLTKASTYALLLVFANLFSVPSYGEVAFAMTLLGLLPYLIYPGTQMLLIPLFVKRGDTSSLFWGFLSLSALAAAVGFLLFQGRDWLVLLLLLIPVGFLYMFFRALLRARHAYHWIQVSDALLQFIYLAMAVLLHSMDKLGLTLAYALAYAASTAFVVWMCRGALKELRFRLDADAIKSYVPKGLAASALLFSVDILGRSDSFLLGMLSSFTDVARYNVAFTLSDIVLVIPLVISMFLLTRSSELDEKASRPVFLRCVRLSFSLSLLCAIALCALVQPLLAIAFSRYADTGILVLALSAGLLFYSAYYLNFTYQSGRFRPESIVLPFVLAAGAKIVLDFLLVPQAGALGMALATLAVGAGLFIAAPPQGFPRRATAFALVSPAFLVPSFVFGAWGLLLLPFAVLFVFKTGLLEKADVEAVSSVLRQFLPARRS